MADLLRAVKLDGKKSNPHRNSPLDLVLGGGIPENRVTEIFGLPDSCKSILAMLIVASKVPVAALECTFEIAILNQPGLQFGQVKQQLEDTLSRTPRMTH